MTCHHAPIDQHQPIPDDEAHCDCDGVLAVDLCECACHLPTDGDVPGTGFDY